MNLLKSCQRLAIVSAMVLLAASNASAQTYTWANSNVDGATPPASLNWFNATQGTWTGGTPVSSNLNTIQFFQDTTTPLPNTVAHTQASVADSGSAFQLGTLTLSGRGSATTNANLIMNLSGDALNFSAATGTVNLDALNNTRTITYNVANNIQLGAVGTPGALTFTGNGTSAFNFTGAISQLEAGGSITKNGTSTVTLGGTSSFTGGLTMNAGVLNLNSNQAFTGGLDINGGTVNLAANQNFTGGITLDGGTMNVNVAQTNAIGSLTMNGGTMKLNSAGTNSLLSGVSSIIFAANSTINPAGSNSVHTLPSVTINPGVLATFNAITGATTTYTLGGLSGSGDLIFQGGTTANAGKVLNLGDASGFTGNLTFNPVIASSGTPTLSFSAMGDTVGKKIIFGVSTNGNYRVPTVLTYTGGVATFSNRQLELGGTASFSNGLTINNNGSGALVFTQALSVTNGGNKTLGLGGSYTATSNAFNGAIPNGPSEAISLTKNGAGTWLLGSASNTFTGAITLSSTTTSAGTLSYASAGGANAITFSQTTGTANLTYNGATAKTMSGPILASALTSGTITLASTGDGAVNYSNSGSLGAANSISARNLILSGTNTGDNTLAGAWVNNTNINPVAGATLTKSGAGKWILSGTNTYTGTTIVNAGTLLVNGNSSAALGAVTVSNAGTTLGGIGIVGGNTILNTDTILSPGNSPGTLTFANNLTLNNGSTYLFEAGDLTEVNGALDLNDNWTLSVQGLGFQDGGMVTLFTYGTLDASPDLDPTIILTGLGFTPGGPLTVGDNGSGSIILNGISIVPEPSTMALLGAGVAFLGLRLARRRGVNG